MGSNDGSISFGKGRKVDFQGFNGIRKDDFNVEGNDKKKKLVEAIFNHYNVDGANGDIVLDRSELAKLQQDVTNYASGGKKGQLGKGEAAKFLQSLGLSKDEYTREELLEILAEINVDEDSVEEAHPNQDGSTSVQYKPDLAGNTKVEVYNAKHVLNYGLVVNDDTETLTEYAADGKTKVAVIEKDKKKHTVLNTKYAADGITVAERYRQVSPAIREDLDPANGDRVVKRTTALGNNLFRTQEYEYVNDGVIELLTNPDGTKVKTTTSNGGMKYVSYIDSNNHETKREAFSGEKKVWTSTYTYDANGRTVNTEHYSADDGSVTTRTRKTQDLNNKTLTHVNVDADGKIQDYKHTVDPNVDTWYGIVQAKYGVTDHKTTMAIVHQLKANHNVARNAKTIPNEITLPGTIKVGNTEYNLININRQVNDIHNIPQQIAIPANIPADQLPKPLPAEELKIAVPQTTAPVKPADLPQAELPQNSVPFPADLPKKIDFAQYQFPIVKENAGKIVKQDNGQFYQYDTRGRVVRIYADENSRNNGNHSVEIEYRDGYDDAKKDWIIINQYDADGHLIGDVTYFEDTDELFFSVVTNMGNNKFKRTEYDMSEKGKVTAMDTYIDEYNSSNQRIETTKYDISNGRVINNLKYLYTNNAISGIEKSFWDSDGDSQKIFYQSLENYYLDNYATTYFYDQSGKLDNIYQCKYDEHGNKIKFNNYDSSGKLTYAFSSDYDANGNETRSVYYEPDGKIQNFQCNNEYRPDGRLIRGNTYTAQGKYYDHYEDRYNTDGTYSNVYHYDSRGRLIR